MRTLGCLCSQLAGGFRQLSRQRTLARVVAAWV
jgi:hypothetical protein